MGKEIAQQLTEVRLIVRNQDTRARYLQFS
jgi:hypothetical protein